MVDTRSKGAPIAKKLSNGRPAKWSASNRADMLQILKQEKVNDNKKFSLSKNSKIWHKVSKELIDDDEQKTPGRCCIHFTNMKREAGYIEHALKLEGVTWNKKTSMLKPVEGALEEIVKKHAKYAYTPYKYYDDIMQIVGKQKLRGVKKEETVEESEEEEEPNDEDKVEGDAEAKDEPEEEKKPNTRANKKAEAKPKTKADNKKASAKKPGSTKAEDDEDDKDAEEPSDEELQQDTPSPKEKAPKKAGKNTKIKKQTASRKATTKAEADKSESAKGGDDNKSIAESKTSKQKRKPATPKHSKQMNAAIAERVKGGKLIAIAQAKLPKNQGTGLETVAEDDEDVGTGKADDAAADSDEEKADQSAEENDSGTESATEDAVRNEEVRKANEAPGIAMLKKWPEGVAVGDERKQGQKRTSSSPAPVSPNSERPRKQFRQASVPFDFRVTKSVNGAGEQKKDLKAESARSSTQSRAGSAILESTEREGTPHTSVRGASVARSLKSNSHEDVKQKFAEPRIDPQEEAMREVQRESMLTVDGKLAMTDLFDDDAKAARMYLRVVDNIEMCKPWLEKQLQKIREADWEDCML